jgi:cytochrome c biogenesis protein CcdA
MLIALPSVANILASTQVKKRRPNYSLYARIMSFLMTVWGIGAAIFAMLGSPVRNPEVWWSVIGAVAVILGGLAVMRWLEQVRMYHRVRCRSKESGEGMAES